MFEVTLQNRLPPLVTSLEVELAGQEVELVYHNGAPILGRNALVYTRHTAVVHDGDPVINGDELVIVSRS